ncbi:MAG: tRNA epoxyqueuosine(34) reductase QueG [Terrimicrobiaceae bacterium]
MPPLSKETLIRLANDLGFSEVGFAPAVRAPHAESFLRWLANGHHADMDWLARDPERRCQPDLHVPGARTVIALAVNYWTGPDAPPLDTEPRGRIARYAWGRDYHNWIPKRLRQLDLALQQFGGTQKTFVDSGPLLERDFAVLAGIAWHGKNSLALHPRLGTWFFLAAVVTTLEIEPDPPLPPRCGSCTRCIEACPTGAITAPGVVDSRKCISYWTIEARGDIPEWIRPLMGDRIFGCDDCLDACPWNRFATASSEANLARREATTRPLTDHLSLDETAFRELFAGSPVRRAKRAGFLRNVCIALGNTGTEKHLPALETASRDSDPLVQKYAQWAISKIRSHRSQSAAVPSNTLPERHP